MGEFVIGDVIEVVAVLFVSAFQRFKDLKFSGLEGAKGRRALGVSITIKAVFTAEYRLNIE